jgi:hypothetical protein
MSLIRTEAEREARKELIQRNREKRKNLQMLPSIDLVCYKISIKISQNLNRKLTYTVIFLRHT